jgi:hypothetical protein
MLADKLLTTFLSLGFTEAEVETLCEDTYMSHRVEKDVFRILYGYKNLTSPHPPQSEDEIGHYLGSWAWALPKELPRHHRFRSAGITTVGLLQMATEKRVEEISCVGEKTLEVVKAYLESRGLRLSRPKERMRTRAERVFRHLHRIPVSYLTVRADVSTRQLEERGIFKLVQLANVPKQRLLAIPPTGGRSDDLDPEEIDTIERELAGLGLSFKQ